MSRNRFHIARRAVARPLAIALVSLTLFACASHREIEASSPDMVMEGVNPGDEVTITSKGGKHYRFVVAKMTNKALYAADGTRVTYAEMSAVDVKNKDGVFKRIGNLF